VRGATFVLRDSRTTRNNRLEMFGYIQLSEVCRHKRYLNVTDRLCACAGVIMRDDGQSTNRCESWTAYVTSERANVTFGVILGEKIIEAVAQMSVRFRATDVVAPKLVKLATKDDRVVRTA
jgi:hypothetical protein